MAVRSIVSIDLRDGPFREFAKKFAAYEAALKKTPGAWALVTKNIDGSRASFDKLVGQMAAANVQEQLRAKAQERADRLTRSSAERWQAMTRDSREFVRNITGATFQLLKWGSLTGLISGLLGAGGLYGIDRLALSAAGSRRSALGLGASIGGQEAFKTNFGRLVDPEAFLQSVGAAKFDVTKRVGLLSAGLSQGQINAKTEDTAVALLDRLKQIADTTNPALYAQVLRGRQLEQFASPFELERLRQTGPAEYQRLRSQFGQRQDQFNVPDAIAERWQNLVTTLDNAGKSIETILIKGLVPLAPGLTKLSESVEKIIGIFVEKGGPLEKWINEAGGALEKFAGYIKTDEFQENVRTFVEGLAVLAKAVGSFVSWFGSGGKVGQKSLFPEPNLSEDVKILGAVKRFGSDLLFGGGVGGGGATPANNPGNLRLPGSLTGFQRFDTPEAGVSAMARQLQIYGSRDHLDTIAGIVNKYAPPNENDTGAYIRDVTKKTGYDSSQHLNLNDKETLSKLVAAMISHEQKRGNYEKYKDASSVRVVIENKTDSTVSTTANGIRQGGP